VVTHLPAHSPSWPGLTRRVTQANPSGQHVMPASRQPDFEIYPDTSAALVFHSQRPQRTSMHDKTNILSWLHQHIPFAAMLATEEIGKRPLLTRLIESIVVAVSAGALSAYVTINILQAVHSSQIDDIRSTMAQEHSDSMAQFQMLQQQISDLAYKRSRRN
jgi:hypothetical protein